MSLEQLADLATVIVAAFVILAAVPAMHFVLQWEWRWRLGAWAAVIHTIWIEKTRNREKDSETFKDKMSWNLRRAFHRPVRFLSRLSNRNWEVTQLRGASPSLTLQSDIHIRESKARNEAQFRATCAQQNMAERQDRRRHRKVQCSKCGGKSTVYLCHPNCEQVNDPRDVGHICYSCSMEDYWRDDPRASTAHSDTESIVK